MIHSQQVEYRRMHVTDMHLVFSSSKTYWIRCTISLTPLDPRTGEPVTVSPRIVIASYTLFTHRHAAKFPTPYDERVVE